MPLATSGDAEIQNELPSPWLYLAGLGVTLSGLYAVNFGLDDTGFTTVTFGLAIVGYVVSYLLRMYRISLKSIQTPLLALVGLAAVALITSDQAAAWLSPAGVQGDRFKMLQLVFAWMAIVHSFLLASDAAVLFACVPCMTMLALVSTHNSDPRIQNAFLVFIGAATFLMVHENYLRTRSAHLKGRFTGRNRQLFGGQIQLTAFCLMAALALANIVAVPIQTLGQTLFVSSGASPFDNHVVRTIQEAAPQVQVGEQKTLLIATGPVADSDQEVMDVICDRPLYWLGATFATYSGTSFTNSPGRHITLSPQPETAGGASAGHGAQTFSRDDFDPDSKRFELPAAAQDISPAEMNGSAEIVQTITVKDGLFSQLYGAESVQEIRASLASIAVDADASGAISTPDTIDRHAEYQVKSRVPTDDASILRSASSSPDAIPDAIRRDCLQVAVNGTDSTKLRNLALQITRGLGNNYDKAVAIKNYIGSNCKYNLNAPAAPRKRDVVENFLLDSHQGYCDSFGAAMTMLCRYAGIPARLASGFLSGDKTGDNTYVVRARHKHIWSEVFFPQVGWITFDATEGAEDITNQSRQHSGKGNGFMAWFWSHGPVPPLIGCLVVALVLFVFMNEMLSRTAGKTERQGDGRVSAQTNQSICRAYLSACHLLARMGLTRENWMTPDEYAHYIYSVSRFAGRDIGENFNRLTRAYNESRYGRRTVTSTEVEQALGWHEDLKRTINAAGREEFRTAAADLAAN